MVSRFKVKRVPVIKVLLVLLNVLSTWLTVYLGLKESPLVTWATGRYDTIRQRLRMGGISYDIVQPEIFRIADLPTPKELADYTVLWTPSRDPSNVGDSRAVCLTINTNSAPVMMNNFNDYWGKSSRRAQIYVNSISAPNCQVVNVKPAWRDQCVADNKNNATLCHKYVLDNFDTLYKNRSIRMAVVKDIGAKGVPFLRCLGRPLVPFNFKADLIGHQTFWSGGDYHASIQTSRCQAIPLVRSSDRDYTLHETVNVDEACDMVLLLPPGGWVTLIVPWLLSIVTIALVFKGITNGLMHTAAVNYLPHALRVGKKRKWLRFALPFMDLITKVSNNDRSIVTFKGSMLVASDVWMTHWLFMWLSILDAVVNLRSTYALVQSAAIMLSFKITVGNVVYLCQALIKLAWITCLVQTIMRMVIKLVARCLRSLRIIRSTTREKINWNADGISILLSFRIYYVMLFALTMTLVVIKGDPSFMVKDDPYKVPAYGGVEDMANFWGSAITCDLVTLIGLQVAISQCVGVLLMYTKYKYVADNSLMRLLQKRYVLSGWDGLLAAHMLGLDPSDPDFLIDGCAYTKVSIGSLLQLLYLSGPSGFVHLGGDYIFHDNGFAQEPVRFRYAIPKALAMGLFTTDKGSAISTYAPATATETATKGPSQTTNSVVGVRASGEPVVTITSAKQSIFDRRLRLVSEGYLEKLLFIDDKQGGQLVTNKETNQREYEVIDALTVMTILDVKHLMGREKKIRVR